MYKLYFNKDLCEYFWTGNDMCNKCKKIIQLKGLLVWDYLLYNFNESLYCFYCRDEVVKTLGRYAEIKTVTLVYEDFLPMGSVVVKPTRLQVGNSSGDSVFEAATVKMEGKVVDRTSLAKPMLLTSKKSSLLLDSDESS